MRWTQPRHPAAFLVDQDRRIRLAKAIPQFLNKRRYLIRRLDIAFEKDKAPRPLGTDKFALRALSSSPDTPVMNARLLMGAD